VEDTPDSAPKAVEVGRVMVRPVGRYRPSYPVTAVLVVRSTLPDTPATVVRFPSLSNVDVDVDVLSRPNVSWSRCVYL
jgi:hypothetical protein